MDEPDNDWDAQARNETPEERLDRNWSDLLQELRVVQTGVQFLTGFMLTLPFQQKFATLSDPERDIYLAALSSAVLSTALLQTPVAVHRALFRRHQRWETVQMAHRLSMLGIAFLAASVVGVVTLIFDVLVGTTGAVVSGIAVLVLLSTLWTLLPISLRRGRPDDPQPASPRR